MPVDNVETMRRAIRAFNERDIDAAAASWSPDIEWHQITPFPDRAVFRGPAQVRKHLLEEQLFTQLDEFRIEPDEFVEVGDHVIMVGHIHGQGRASELPFRLRIVFVTKFEDGKITWVYDCSGESRRP